MRRTALFNEADRSSPLGAAKPEEAGNHRNGRSAKTVLTEDGPLRIEMPRDQAGSFEPILIPKHERRFTGFDDKIIAMCPRGMRVHACHVLVINVSSAAVSYTHLTLPTKA